MGDVTQMNNRQRLLPCGWSQCMDVRERREAEEGDARRRRRDRDGAQSSSPGTSVVCHCRSTPVHIDSRQSSESESQHSLVQAWSQPDTARVASRTAGQGQPRQGRGLIDQATHADQGGISSLESDPSFCGCRRWRGTWQVGLSGAGRGRGKGGMGVRPSTNSTPHTTRPRR